jgi:uncharacterized protein
VTDAGGAEPTPADRARVAELLGREPQGSYSIAARDAAGDPLVIENAPFLDDGTPMPTMFWLIGPEWVRRIGQLEAAGGVDAAEAAVDPDELAAAHARYAAVRDAKIPEGHAGPRPSGGVGGTRTGVKCLHAHWAWHLAGGDDPVGRWIADRIETEPDVADSAALEGVYVDIRAEATVLILPSGHHAGIPWGYATLTSAWLADADPPPPAGLTNALGVVDDHLDDVEREHPEVEQLARTAGGVSFGGDTITALAQLELGRADTPAAVALDRAAAEDVFRLVATESAAERAHNPGLPSEHVDTIVATCCVVLSVMRRFHLEQVTLQTGGVPREAAL